MAAYTCNLVLNKSRDKRGFLDGRSSLAGKFQARGKPFLQRNEADGVGGPIPKLLL